LVVPQSGRGGHSGVQYGLHPCTVSRHGVLSWSSRESTTVTGLWKMPGLPALRMTVTVAVHAPETRLTSGASASRNATSNSCRWTRSPASTGSNGGGSGRWSGSGSHGSSSGCGSGGGQAAYRQRVSPTQPRRHSDPRRRVAIHSSPYDRPASVAASSMTWNSISRLVRRWAPDTAPSSTSSLHELVLVVVPVPVMPSPTIPWKSREAGVFGSYQGAGSSAGVL